MKDTIRDLLVDAWHRECDEANRPTDNVPERQRVFATVALDARLTHHDDPTLRARTIAAYHRRPAKLGLIAAPAEGGDDEA